MKVCISSTFNDLREYRAAAADVLRKLGHDVRGMETYVAESSRPVDPFVAMVDHDRESFRLIDVAPSLEEVVREVEQQLEDGL
jgi:hypothetical protein